MQDSNLPKFYIITATEILDTGMVSFKFMFDSGSDIDMCLSYNNFGYAKLDKKSDNHVNPFKLVRGEPGAIGDDGVKRWNPKVCKRYTFLRFAYAKGYF